MPERWSLSDDIDVPPNIQGDDLRRAVNGTAVLARPPHGQRDAHRRRGDGRETFDMPRADDALARASYTSRETYAHPVIAGKRASDDDSLDGLRRWVQVGVNVGAPPRPITQIRQIVPRGDSEAWVLASEGDDTHVLVHMSRPAMAPAAAPLLVGSETDQRNELRNVEEPVTG